MSETTNKPKQQEEIRPFRCEVCNITCNTKDLLEKHKQEKKHLKALQKPADSSAIAPKTVSPPIASETLAGGLENKKQEQLQHEAKADMIYCDLCNVAIIQLASRSGLFGATSYSSIARAQKKPNTFQCGLCKITCTSNELLRMHVAGKKHLNKLKESGQIPNLPLTPTASPMVNPESNKGTTVNSDGGNSNGKRAGSHEDVESKRQKILQGGAPLNAIRTCTLCNVVCNSPTVFEAHLGGQKHAAMVVKQAEIPTGQES